jgi:ribosomal protein S6
MTTYELMVVVNSAVDLTGDKAQKDLVEKLVGAGATVTEVTSLGKKTLAYPIKKQTEATYLLATVTGTVKSADIDKKSKLMDEVLRFLLTVKE